MTLVLFWALAFALAAAAVPLVRRLALAAGVVDVPAPRKIHASSVPLLGGAAILLAAGAAVAAAVFAGLLPSGHIHGGALVGLGLGALLLAIGGALDDRYDLPPGLQILFPVAAALVAVLSGIGVQVVTNPLGGVIVLGGFSSLLTFLWLIGMTYTTKVLDGMDGLVSGVTAIGGLIIAAVSLTRDISQPETALLALVVSGAYAGFLLFNFHPAKIFLGEGGATLAGFLLGGLAVIAGGKIATTLLVVGLPVFDLAFAVIRRVAAGKPWYKGDRSHLHHRLLDAGLSQRQVVLVFYAIALGFGLSTLVLESWQKMLAIMAIAGVLVALVRWAGKRSKEPGL